MLRSLPRSPQVRCLRWKSSQAAAAATAAAEAAPWAQETLENPIPKRQLFRGKPVRRALAAKRTIFVRTWENMRGPLDVLTIVQHLEKAFGKIDEYSSAKDEYALGNWLLVRFHELDSTTRALASKGTFKIPSPPSISCLNLGLNDIRPFLQSQKHDPDFTLTPHTETQESTATGSENIIITIRECSSEYDTTYKALRQPLSIRAASALVNWHGFAPIKPLPPNTPLDTPDVDHPTMRAVIGSRVGMLRRKYPGLVNPLESDNPASLHGQEEVESVIEMGMDEQNREDSYDWKPLELVTDDTLQHVVEEKAATQPKVQTSPAPKPEPQSKPEPSRPQPPPMNPAVEAALAAAQLKSADDILKSLRQPKPPPKAQAQPQKTKTQLKIQPKKPQPLFETDAGMEMKEEAALEPEKKADEAPVKEEGAKGRFQRFLGGWF